MSNFGRAVEKCGGRRATAEKLGCSVEFVRLMLAGQKTPGLTLAFKIEQLLGVPVSVWKRRPASRLPAKAAS